MIEPWWENVPTLDLVIMLKEMKDKTPRDDAESIHGILVELGKRQREPEEVKPCTSGNCP